MTSQLINETLTAATLPIQAAENFDYDFDRVREIKEPGPRYNGRYDMELAMAVQRQMLPQNAHQLATVRYAGASVAARGLGGDYYDFLHLGPASLGLVLADVSGKGIAAALLMANLQALIHCQCIPGIYQDPKAMLESVNTQFLAATLPEQYATLFFGQYDDEKRQLDYVNCGQQPAILVRRDGSIERLRTTAMPLGLVRSWVGEKHTVELMPGDMVYVCSDGVVEAGLESGMEFGEERLFSLITNNPNPDMDHTVARILDAARLYELNGPADDMTAIGMRCV